MISAMLPVCCPRRLPTGIDAVVEQELRVDEQLAEQHAGPPAQPPQVERGDPEPGRRPDRGHGGRVAERLAELRRAVVGGAEQQHTPMKRSDSHCGRARSDPRRPDTRGQVSIGADSSRYRRGDGPPNEPNDVVALGKCLIAGETSARCLRAPERGSLEPDIAGRDGPHMDNGQDPCPPHTCASRCASRRGPDGPRRRGPGQGALAGPGTTAGSRGVEARGGRARPDGRRDTWLALTSDHLERPRAAALYWGYLIAASMAIGAYWWTRRPASRFGPLLVAFGILVWVVSWQAADWPLAFDIGVLAEAPFFVLTFYLFLAFPMGRLEPSGRWLMWVLGFGVVAFFLPWALFSPVIAGGGPLTGCAPACPQNVLQVGSAPTLVEVAGKGETYLALAITAAVFVVYLARLRTASRPHRRTLMAVAVTSLLFLPAYSRSAPPPWVRSSSRTRSTPWRGGSWPLASCCRWDF